MLSRRGCLRESTEYKFRLSPALAWFRTFVYACTGTPRDLELNMGIEERGKCQLQLLLPTNYRFALESCRYSCYRLALHLASSSINWYFNYVESPSGEFL